MAYAEFYNLNANTSYPFVTTSTDTFMFMSGRELPNRLIVDCGFTIGPALDFNPEIGAVYLRSAKRDGNNLILTFRADSGSTTTDFVFVRYMDDPFGRTDYVEASGGPLFGIGFLVTGDIHSLYDLLAPTEEDMLLAYSAFGHLTRYEATVEPALIVSNRKQSALSISVGNMLRLNEGQCDSCGGSPPVIDNKTIKLQASASHMVGRLKFRSGYNAAITASPVSNALSFVAVIGEGLGEVCDNDPIRYVGDVPDQGSRCKDYIYTINGIVPNKTGAFQLEGGGSFVVKPDVPGFLIINSRLSTQVVCSDG